MTKLGYILNKVFYILGVAIVLNIVIVSIIDSFKNGTYNEATIFKRLPQTFLWNFEPEPL